MQWLAFRPKQEDCLRVCLTTNRTSDASPYISYVARQVATRHLYWPAEEKLEIPWDFLE